MNTINKPIKIYSNQNFRGENIKMSDDKISPKKNNTLALSLAGVGVLGIIITTAAGMLSKKTRAQALVKAGLELKDGLIYVKETGEKFTGTIKRNVSAFGFKKEITNIENGMLKEILNYGLMGKELKGYFFKDGNLLYQTTTPKRNSKRKYYACYKYEKGKLQSMSDCVTEPKQSVFKLMCERVKQGD